MNHPGDHDEALEVLQLHPDAADRVIMDAIGRAQLQTDRVFERTMQILERQGSLVGFDAEGRHNIEPRVRTLVAAAPEPPVEAFVEAVFELFGDTLRRYGMRGRNRQIIRLMKILVECPTSKGMMDAEDATRGWSRTNRERQLAHEDMQTLWGRLLFVKRHGVSWQHLRRRSKSCASTVK
jgi:hypothetical protein